MGEVKIELQPKLLQAAILFHVVACTAAIARAADWPHFPAVKETFPAADYAPATGTLIFNIGGNKYRPIARVDFEDELLAVQTVLNRREYDRGEL